MAEGMAGRGLEVRGQFNQSINFENCHGDTRIYFSFHEIFSRLLNAFFSRMGKSLFSYYWFPGVCD